MSVIIWALVAGVMHIVATWVLIKCFQALERSERETQQNIIKAELDARQKGDE
jgi:hypothetical protein